jgi:uncharacterized protein YjbI with pentapeptide repeats
MREDELIQALFEGGERWRRFRKTGGVNRIKDAELSERDISDRDLADLDLSNMDFFRTNLHRTNLKKSNLSGAELTEANLTKAALYKCDLRKAVLQEADLSNADLSACDCTGADFRGANLKGANLSDAILVGANFSLANLTGAKLCDADLTATDFTAANLDQANVIRVRYGGYKSMIGKYYGIRGIDNSFGNAVFVRDAKDQDYIDTLHETIRTMPNGFMKSLDLLLLKAWGLIDHGRSLLKVGFYAMIISTFYGLIYTLDIALGWELMDYSNSAHTWFTPVYSSGATSTTLGFGDVPADSLIGEMLVISEVIAGYFTLGLLLSILANTVARRS